MAEKNECERQQTISAWKRQLRREILARRDALSEAEQAEAEIAIAKKILTHSWYREAEIVLGFASYGSEIRTDKILQETLQAGKQLYLPKIIGDEMLFFRVEDMRELQAGYKGIREPQGVRGQFVYEQSAGKDLTEPYSKLPPVLMLVPGVAFDKKRGRMGYGKGFYDRFLADKPLLASHTIGIAHACQLVEEVPCEETDVSPAQVIYV